MSEISRGEFLLAGLAALGGAVLLGAEQEPPRQPPPPVEPPQCGPDGCPVHLVRSPQRAIGAPPDSYFGVVLDLPPEMRTKNWGGGSCVHASTVNLLKWMGQFEMAEWWRANYSGGEYDSRLIQRMEAAGLKYAWSRDPSFFNWCARTRRGAGIFYKPSHAINFVGITSPTPENFGQYPDREVFNLLDNNATGYPEQHGHYELVMRREFEERWRGYGSFAWTLIYDPPAGIPT